MPLRPIPGRKAVIAMRHSPSLLAIRLWRQQQAHLARPEPLALPALRELKVSQVLQELKDQRARKVMPEIVVQLVQLVQPGLMVKPEQPEQPVLLGPMVKPEQPVLRVRRVLPGRLARPAAVVQLD